LNRDRRGILLSSFDTLKGRNVSRGKRKGIDKRGGLFRSPPVWEAGRGGVRKLVVTIRGEIKKTRKDYKAWKEGKKKKKPKYTGKGRTKVDQIRAKKSGGISFLSREREQIGFPKVQIRELERDPGSPTQ